MKDWVDGERLEPEAVSEIDIDVVGVCLLAAIECGGVFSFSLRFRTATPSFFARERANRSPQLTKKVSETIVALTNMHSRIAKILLTAWSLAPFRAVRGFASGAFGDTNRRVACTAASSTVVVS